MSSLRCGAGPAGRVRGPHLPPVSGDPLGPYAGVPVRELGRHADAQPGGDQRLHRDVVVRLVRDVRGEAGRRARLDQVMRGPVMGKQVALMCTGGNATEPELRDCLARPDAPTPR